MTSSVSEENYIPPSSKAQFNGDVQGDLNHSASMENISSIHNNIFYRTFGKPVKYHSQSSSKPATNNDENFGGESTNDNNDDNMEYRPVSGFVHRLMGRFSKGDSANNAPLSPSSASPSVPLSKRFSSMEDITTDNDSSKKTVAFEDTTTITNAQKQNVSSNLSHRARSIECLSTTSSTRKPQSQTRPLAVPHLRHVETKQDREKPLKSPRESKVIAPDVDLARDDIIIIENTPSVPALQLSSGDQHNDSGSDIEVPQLHSYREEMLPEELPKPNTVFTVRSIFETAASVSSTPSSALAQRRRKSDSSDISVEKTTTQSSSSSSETNRIISNHNSSSSISSPTTVLSPRIAASEASTAAPVFKLDQTTSTSSSNSTRSSYLYSSPRSPVVDLYSPHYNIPTDGKSSSLSSSTTISATSTASSLPTSYTRQLSSSKQSTPREDTISSKDSSSSSTPSSARSDQGSSLSSTPSSSLSSSTTVETKLPSAVERGSLFDSRPAPSPRSTASVKPTIAQNPPAAVKPIPLSAPASAATSYKKSSPVVPVAPFKKREEVEDDGTPVLIYQKSKSPRSKPERQNLNNLNGKQANKEEKDDLIIPKDAKKIFEKENEQSSKYTSQRKNNDNIKSNDSKPYDEDKNDLDKGSKQNVAGHTSVISVTKEKTVINLTRTNASAGNNENDQVDGTSKKGKNNFAPSAPQPTRPPRSKSYNVAESTGKSRPAPMPPKPSVIAEDREASEADKAKKQEGSMIYISSSDSSGESDSTTPPETPRTRPPPSASREPPLSVTVSSHDSTPIIPFSPREPPVKSREIPSISPSPKEPPRIPREPPSTTPSPQKPRIVPQPDPSDEPKEKPIKGIPSIIANRLNKHTNSPREISDAIIDSKKESGRDSPDSFAVSLRKTGSASIVSNNKSETTKEDDNKRDSVSNDIEMQIANMRKKMDNSRNKGGSGATQIFDSSQLAQKRKERKEAAAKAAAAASSQGIVPPLDFSSLNDDNRSNQAYMRKKEIKPCNIKFIGENAPTSRNLLKKQRKVKINIQFRADISDTFEYPSEDTALQHYLEEHPNEPEELEEEEPAGVGGGGGGILFLDGLGGGGGGNGGGFGESSDDVDEDVSTPRGRRDDEEDGLRSNPALSSTSTLQSYRGRFQEEFVFGSHRQEPEPVAPKQEPEPVEDPDSMMLRPAEETTVDTWSTNSSSDLLF